MLMKLPLNGEKFVILDVEPYRVGIQHATMKTYYTIAASILIAFAAYYEPMIAAYLILAAVATPVMWAQFQFARYISGGNKDLKMHSTLTEVLGIAGLAMIQVTYWIFIGGPILTWAIQKS